MTPTEGTPASPAKGEELGSYQKKLFVFLSVATFFEGYDFMALSQILPELVEDLSLSAKWWPGVIGGVINVGTVAAFLVVKAADKWGRSRMLTVTIAGYTLFTFATGFAPDVYTFLAFQLLARIFLIGEWAVSMVIAAEEFPATKRGMVIGVISACSSLGAIFCVGVVPLLLSTPYGWRTVYFVGIVPLVILAYARRNLKETERFSEQQAERVAAGQTGEEDFFRIWKGPYRNRMLQLALIWAVAYVCAQNAVHFWKLFVVAERGFTAADASKAITIAAVVSMPMVFYAGRLIDVVGRRPGATIIFSLGALGTFVCYTLHGFWPLTGGLIFGIFGASAYLPVLNSYTSELFPTDLRGNAFAWCNNLLGRIGYVGSPVVVGFLAEEVGAYGPVVSATALFPLITVGLIWWLMPETKGRELEETALLH